MTGTGIRRAATLLGLLGLLGGCITIEGDEQREIWSPYAQVAPTMLASLRQAYALLGQGKAAEAQVEAQKAIATSPVSLPTASVNAGLTPPSAPLSMAYTLLAAALAAQRKLDPQIEVALGGALRADSGNWVARFNLGNFYLASHRHHDAAEQYREAIRLNPGHRDAWLNLATAQASGGRTERAEGSVKHVLKMDPKCAEAHNLLGTIYLDEGLPAEAIVEIKAAVALQPQRPEFQLNLARVLELSDRRADAAVAYRRFLELAPADDLDRASVTDALARVQK